MNGELKMDNKECYWAGGSGEDSERMYFDRYEAFASGHNFLDAFDESGEFVACYKFVDDEYTLDW